MGWYSDDAESVPLYRLYNKNEFNNNHNYTASEDESDWLVGLGWKYEGIAWYGAEHSHSWQAHTIEEPVYEEQWVSNMVEVFKGRQTKLVCNKCGFIASSKEEMDQHVISQYEEARKSGDTSPTCGGYTNDSYDIWEWEDQGS